MIFPSKTHNLSLLGKPMLIEGNSKNIGLVFLKTVIVIKSKESLEKPSQPKEAKGPLTNCNAVTWLGF